MRLFSALALAFVAACGDGGREDPKDAAPADAAPATPDADCFDITNKPDPTHNEIINACTTATKVFKTGKPPLENPDGSLPPLPQ